MGNGTTTPQTAPKTFAPVVYKYSKDMQGVDMVDTTTGRNVSEEQRQAAAAEQAALPAEVQTIDTELQDLEARYAKGERRGGFMNIMPNSIRNRIGELRAQRAKIMQANPKSTQGDLTFDTAEAAEDANLPAGTIVTVNGKRFRVQ